MVNLLSTQFHQLMFKRHVSSQINATSMIQDSIYMSDVIPGLVRRLAAKNSSLLSGVTVSNVIISILINTLSLFSLTKQK